MKKIVSLLTALVVMCSFTCSAFASAFDDIYDMDYDAIKVIYNGDLLSFGDVLPEEIDGRVMLPFRAVLESMGAEVMYHASADSVTAVRGDTTIDFAIGGDIIYVDKNGEKSEIKSDVPIIEKNDRALVPVRFISEALGMRIAWRDWYNTVYIVDIEAYMDKLEKNATNLMKLFEMEQPDVEYNTDAISLSLDLNVLGTTVPMTLNIDYKNADGVVSINGTVDGDLSEFYYKLPSINDAKFEVIIDGEEIYFKTDLVKQIVSNSKELDLMAYLIEDEWYQISITELFDFMFEDSADEAMEFFNNIMASVSSMDKKDMLKEVLNSILDENPSIYSAERFDDMIDMYILMDKYITVNENSVSIKIDNNMMREFMELSGDYDEYDEEFLNTFTVDVSSESTFDYNDTEYNSKGIMEFLYKFGPARVSGTLNVEEKAKIESNIAPAKIPETAKDLLELLKEF